MPQTITPNRRIWTLVIVSLGLFMTVLDNLVVNVALPSIHRDLGASIQTLEWTVNAYVLAYAVLLLTGSALGDRFGRKRMFMVGISVFTAGSAAAALSPTIDFLIAARALQGVGAAIVTPLTLTLLAEAFPPEQRGLALGVWSAISGIGVAAGPLVGGALTQASSWHLIFWVNVPIGLALIPLAGARLTESRGSVKHLDLPGLALASTGLFGLVFGLVRSQSLGWGSPEVVISLAAGVVLVLAFIAQELRTDEPMLPMEFFANRGFAVTNAVSLAMYFGMFGSIFFLSQFLQNVLHNTPLQAGVKLLVWTGAVMVVAPVAGFMSERYGSRLFMIAGLALQAIALGWMASVAGVGESYASLVIPFALAGSGMALVFAPVGQRGAGLGADLADRAGVGRHQRDPRARRRARHRGPRHRVHEPRQLPVAPGLRQRSRAGAVGRRSRARRRRADRGRAPVQHSRLGLGARGRGSGDDHRRGVRSESSPA